MGFIFPHLPTISQNNFSSPILRKTTPSLFSLKSFSSTSCFFFLRKTIKFQSQREGGKKTHGKTCFHRKACFDRRISASADVLSASIRRVCLQFVTVLASGEEAVCPVLPASKRCGQHLAKGVLRGELHGSSGGKEDALLCKTL